MAVTGAAASALFVYTVWLANEIRAPMPRRAWSDDDRDEEQRLSRRGICMSAPAQASWAAAPAEQPVCASARLLGGDIWPPATEGLALELRGLHARSPQSPRASAAS